MRYTGKIFHPTGTTLNLDMANLSPIQGHTAYTLYGQFKHEMNHDEFDARVDAEERWPAVLLRFQRVGQTSGFAAFARGHDATAERLEAVVAFLSRLDPGDDTRVIDQLRRNPHLAMIADEDWNLAASDSVPLAAAFFTNQPALNDPLIHGLMSLAGAAFFDRLGLLE